MRKLPVLLVFLSCFSLTLTAQTQTITGRIVDLVSGAGIPGVSIIVTQNCPPAHGSGPRIFPIGSAQTDADGRYVLTYSPITNDLTCPPTSMFIFFSFSKPGYIFSSGTVVRGGESVLLGTNLPTLASVSAANYRNSFAAEMITAAFGTNLAATTEAATSTPLPTSLAGRSVMVSDSQGVEKAAQLLFVSPSQTNYIIPAGLAGGPAAVKLITDNQTIRAGFITLQNVAPSVFAANANGQGVAAALAQRVKADGTQSYEPVAQFDAAQNKFTPLPVDLGPETEQLYLVLFGTGWRHLSSLSAVRVSVGGTDAQVTYAGLQPTIAGLDQINVLLPRSLAGRGEVEVALTIDGVIANSVQVSIK